MDALRALRFVALGALVSCATACGTSEASLGHPAVGDGEHEGPTPSDGSVGDGNVPPVPSGPPAVSKPVPPPRPRNVGIAYVHGTGDQGVVSDLTCGEDGGAWHCSADWVISGYWTQSNIDTQRTAEGGELLPYVVVACPLGSRAPWTNPSPVKRTDVTEGSEDGSAACVASQIETFLKGPDGALGTDDDITDLAVVTHSGGSNVTRYILEQTTASPAFAHVRAATRGVVGLAAPTLGTYLADWVFTNGSVGSIGLGVVDFFGGAANFDDDGTAFIRTFEMVKSNRDAARFVGIRKDQSGIPWYVAAGNYPYAAMGDDKAACGGYERALALQALHEAYLDTDDGPTARDSCSDGFIPCVSAMAQAEGDRDRVLFGQMGKDVIGHADYRSHQQTMSDCNGNALDVRARLQRILDKRTLPPLDTESVRVEGDTVVAYHWGEGTKSAAPEHPAVTSEAPVARMTEVGDAHIEGGTVSLLASVRAFAPSSLSVRAWVRVLAEDGKTYELDVARGMVATGSSLAMVLEAPLPAGVTGATVTSTTVVLVRHDDATTQDVRTLRRAR